MRGIFRTRLYSRQAKITLSLKLKKLTLRDSEYSIQVPLGIGDFEKFAERDCSKN